MSAVDLMRAAIIVGISGTALLVVSCPVAAVAFAGAGAVGARGTFMLRAARVLAGLGTIAAATGLVILIVGAYVAQLSQAPTG